MRAELHTSLPSLDPHLPAWQALAEDLSLPYCTPAWMLAFWRHRHSAHARLRVVTVHEGDELLGVVPLYRQQQRARPAVLWLLASGFGQRTAPLARPGRELDVARAAAPLLKGRGRVAAIELPAMPACTWPQALGQAFGAPGAPQTWQQEDGLLIDLEADFATWLQAKSKNFRKKHARRRRDLEAAGITVRRSTPATLAADLDAMFDLHRARFAAASKASSITADVEAAVRDAATRMLPGGRAVHLVLDGPTGIVGGDLHFVAGDRMCGWNGGFDPAHADLSPGTVLMDAAVEHAHELGLKTIDLGAGDQEFKLRFAERQEPLRWTRIALRPAAAKVLELETTAQLLRTRARNVVTRRLVAR